MAVKSDAELGAAAARAASVRTSRPQRLLQPRPRGRVLRDGGRRRAGLRTEGRRRGWGSTPIGGPILSRARSPWFSGPAVRRLSRGDRAHCWRSRMRCRTNMFFPGRATSSSKPARCAVWGLPLGARATNGGGGRPSDEQKLSSTTCSRLQETSRRVDQARHPVRRGRPAPSARNYEEHDPLGENWAPITGRATRSRAPRYHDGPVPRPRRRDRDPAGPMVSPS